MDKKFIKTLEVLGDYVKEHNNCTLFEIPFDESGNLVFSKDIVYCLNGSRGHVTTPIPFGRDMETFFDGLLGSEINNESPNDSEYNSYEMIIDSVSRKITIYGVYYDTVVSESYNKEIELEGEERKLFWDKLSSEIGSNQSTFNVDIIGGGDSGYLECALHRLPDDVEEILYGILEEFAPGWEINEGSSGSFVINPTEKTIEFNLDVYDNEQKSEEEYMIVF